MTHLLRLVGKVIGVNADAVAADEARPKREKFHFVCAASRTLSVSMPNLLEAESSFTRAMFTSRWVFSMTLAASATLIEGSSRFRRL